MSHHVDISHYQGVHQAGGVLREDLHDPEEHPFRRCGVIGIEASFGIELLDGGSCRVHLHQKSHAIVEVGQGLRVQALDRRPPGHSAKGRLELGGRGIRSDGRGLGDESRAQQER